MSIAFDHTDPTAIDTYSEQLIGKTLRDFMDVEYEITGKGRGDLGSLVEEYFFHHRAPNTHDPDFAEAGLELKVTGLKRLKNGSLTPKERLVLGMISYHSVVDENFGESYIYKKIRLMLILFYLYDKSLSYLDMRFIAKKLWRLKEEDLILIAKDWSTIVDKIRAGKAHELSEGDTLYLGACTKASTSEARTSQPYSDEPAKPRAFALKASYVRVIMEDTLQTADEYTRLLDDDSAKKYGLEDYVVSKLHSYIDEDVNDLLRTFAPEISPKNKSRYAILTNRLLGAQTRKIEEFEKAGIIIRTVRLSNKGIPKESISTPHFNYEEITQQTWDESDFKDFTESKVMFVVLQEQEDRLIFKGVRFWSMPYKDRLEAQRVWEETVTRIKSGHADQLPLTDFSHVAHVRPHGANKMDTLPAPGGLNVEKKCFWLNASYIGQVLNVSKDSISGS